jgi:hypothetical protein
MFTIVSFVWAEYFYLWNFYMEISFLQLDNLGLPVFENNVLNAIFL